MRFDIGPDQREQASLPKQGNNSRNDLNRGSSKPARNQDQAGKSAGRGNNSGKVIKYRRPININIGLVVFAVILVYLIIVIMTYITSDKVVGYEVKTGSLSGTRVYQGIALRNEVVVTSDYAGYVNYYNEEADRLGKDNLACTIDESGRIMDLINSENAGEISLNESELAELKNDIISFVTSYDPASFYSVYDFQTSIMSATQQMASNRLLENIDSMDTGGVSSSIHYCYAPVTGDIIYFTDGYEQKKFEDIRMSDLDRTAYEKNTLQGGQLVAVGDPIYKISTDENWSIVIPVDSQEEAEKLAAEGYLKVRFLKNQYESWAKLSMRGDETGQYFLDLAFTNSMVTFCTDRFLDIELITEEKTGLKVPNSSIVESNFFLVPKEYVTTGKGGIKGVLRETYAEDGSKSTVFIASTPYSETKDMYYLDQNVLHSGDILIRPDSSDTYVLSAQDKLIGVYNINKGYADFRLVDILYSNEEYSIVTPGNMYGLSEYDYIVLDASSITPDQFIYQ